jgi:site-specific DNA recombinase
MESQGRTQCRSAIPVVSALDGWAIRWAAAGPARDVVSTTISVKQTQLDRNKRLAQRNAHGERYLVQGLTVCAICGYAFSGRSAKGHAYYYCQGTLAHRFGGQHVCRNPSVRGDQLDEYVWKSVTELLQDPARILNEWSR